VSDKKQSYSVRGPLIAVLLLVLALLTWYLFGTQLKDLFAGEEIEQPPVVEEPTPELPNNEELFFDPDLGDEPNVENEEQPNTGDAPVVEEPPTVENPPEVDLSALKLNREDFTLSIGESFRLLCEPEVEGIIWSAKDGAVVSVSDLLEKGILSKCEYGVKVLGNGEVTKKLTVRANAFSASAKEKIEKAGGKAEVI
jgi:hypothetical protein